MIYDYQCIQCESIKEQQHGMNETPIYHCDQCGALTRKIISATFGKMADHDKHGKWCGDSTYQTKNTGKYKRK
jgi:putative FmdB family regulatory protein